MNDNLCLPETKFTSTGSVMADRPGQQPKSGPSRKTRKFRPARPGEPVTKTDPRGLELDRARILSLSNAHFWLSVGAFAVWLCGQGLLSCGFCAVQYGALCKP